MKWRNDKIVTSSRLIVVEDVTMRELTLECGHTFCVPADKGIPAAVDCGACRQVEREKENQQYLGA